jgi:lipid-A-disaccharide synthase-like uncharacterized protein
VIRRLIAAAALVVALGMTQAVLADDTGPADPAVESTLRLRVKPLPPGVRKVELQTDADGRHWYLLLADDGSRERLSPDAFATRLDLENRHRSWAFELLNITATSSVAWVALGLLGQVLFTGRMVLQWLVSERSRRSVVPIGFWWMSLGGASMLLAYFIWRRDIVGVLGQSTGWFIYLRNLWLIYRERRVTSATGAG